MAKKKKEFIQVKLRLRPEMYEQLKRGAAVRQWSLNAEITTRLAGSFERDEDTRLWEMVQTEKRRADMLEAMRLRAIRSGNVDDLMPPEAKGGES